MTQMMICPKAKECNQDEYLCGGHNKVHEYMSGACELINNTCPACVPYEPESWLLSDEEIIELHRDKR